ncbi:MAG: methyl-accepting chemotaxis protein [Acidiferrobacterales bacterium]|nr:methyl-accepting chemotaxis protein [Acidiferrobacterales bacterium]
MNDKTEKEALNEIFEELQEMEESELFEAKNDMGAAVEGDELNELEKSLFEPEGQDENLPYTESDEKAFEEMMAGAAAMGLDDGFEDGENPMDDLFDGELDEEIPPVGFNWQAVVFGIVLIVSSAAFLLNYYRGLEVESVGSQISNNVLSIELDNKDIAYQTLRLVNGEPDAFEKLTTLRRRVDGQVSVMNSSVLDPNAPEAIEDVGVLASTISKKWIELGSQVDLILGNRSVIDNTMEQVKMVNEVTPKLLTESDKIVNKLIQNEASLKLINVGGEQRFLTQRIKASANQFAMGSAGWEEAAEQFAKDVIQFGQVNNDIRTMSGDAVASNLGTIDSSYQMLVSSADSIIGNVGQYSTVLGAADEIKGLSEELQEATGDLLGVVDDGHSVSDKELTDYIPELLIAIAFFSLLGLIWSLIRHTSKQEHISNLRTKRSEDAVIKLLDEMGDLAQGDLTVEAQVTNEVTGAIADSVNFAIGEMRILVNGIKTASNDVSVTTEDSEEMIATLLTSNDAQSEEILNAAQEIEEMSLTMERMSGSALQSSERARVTAESAKKGASAVRNTILGMNSTRNQIQDTAKRLKRLGESSQQINEIVNLIQDVTEQTNVLSLNASIQAAMAGEAGRGFAVVAEEVQRLADRSARASSEITELVKNIQQDANNAISSMETTTEEVITGAKMADEAGQALDEIERISQELYDAIERVASEATEESTVAKTVSSRMNNLKSATEQADLSVSQVAAALGQVRDVVDRLNQSVAGFQLPG